MTDKVVKMFVANCTGQAQDFIYRIPNTPSSRLQRIEVGRQIQISGDLDVKAVQAIVRQHAKYGLVHVSEIDRTRPFSGLCWDEQRINVDKVKRLYAHNQAVLSQRGRENRQAAAVAANNSVAEQLGDPDALKSFEMSVEEEKTEKNPDADFKDGVRVTSDPAETNGKGKATGKGKSKASET